MVWEKFENHDPNIKIDFDKVVNKKVILLMCTDDERDIFDQLYLLLWLQSFYAPQKTPEAAQKSWKDAVSKCLIDFYAVKEITVIRSDGTNFSHRQFVKFAGNIECSARYPLCQNEF